jgi:hypothetical protein
MCSQFDGANPHGDGTLSYFHMDGNALSPPARVELATP